MKKRRSWSVATGGLGGQSRPQLGCGDIADHCRRRVLAGLLSNVWDARGSAAVEFAFLAPVLVLIVAAIIQVGNLTQTAILARNAAREGARYASVGDYYDATTVPISYMTNALGNRGDVTVGSVTINPSTAPNPGTSITVSLPITVTFTMPVIQNLLGNSMQFNATATIERFGT